MNLWSNGFIICIVLFLGTHRNGWFNLDIGISMGVGKNQKQDFIKQLGVNGENMVTKNIETMNVGRLYQ